MDNVEFSKKLKEINSDVAEMFLSSVDVNSLSDKEKDMVLRAFKQADELTKRMFPSDTTNSFTPPDNNIPEKSLLPNDIMEMVTKNIKDNEKFVDPIDKDSIDDLSLLLNSTNSIDDFLNKI